MRIYLDACCLSRPFDDQTIDRNRLEAEAILAILDHVYRKELTLLASDALELELDAIPSPDKREFAKALLSLASEAISIGAAQVSRAAEIEKMGFRTIDALHLACAEAGRCRVFLTTDDGILKLANRRRGRLKVSVSNPLDWMKEQVDHEKK